LRRRRRQARAGETQQQKIDATTINRGRGVEGWGGNLLFILLNAEAEETNFKRGG
jgi:hypothetical protein